MATVPSGNLHLLQYEAAGRYLLDHGLPRVCRKSPCPSACRTFSSSDPGLLLTLSSSLLTLLCSALPLLNRTLPERSHLWLRSTTVPCVGAAGTSPNSPSATSWALHLAPGLTRDTGNEELCPVTAVSYHISAQPGTRTFCTAPFTREMLC